MREEVKWKVREARRAKKGEIFFFFTDDSMRSGHCAKTNKRANVQHPWAYVNPLVSVLAHFLTTRPALAEPPPPAADGRGLFCASTHFPRTLLLPCAPSLSLFRSPCGSLARKVKFTNPYGAPRASNERSSFSLSFPLRRFFSASVHLIFLLIFY